MIRGGYNVYPREIEEVICQIPEVSETAVIGISHEDPGEAIAACVAFKDGVHLDHDAVRIFVKERVTPYKYHRLLKYGKIPFPRADRERF
ncbi:MAG: hypothetical protein E4H15_00870 [Syntrophobacterales bacterium]|nr:MAG: hypothetical protein E4H15_00870 [Syntrophobacterales bacterium]